MDKNRVFFSIIFTLLGCALQGCDSQSISFTNKLNLSEAQSNTTGGAVQVPVTTPKPTPTPAPVPIRTANPAPTPTSVTSNPSGNPTWPVTIPGGATSYADLEQASGWSGDADSTISPNPPTVHTINQSGSPVVMTLDTKGTSGLYTGWMAKKSISIESGQLHMLLRGTYTFDSVSGIQAWEMGRRLTNANGVTDNGQTQLVPLSNGQLEFDIVPSSSGGWKDTGCRFPTFVTGTTYEEDLYYIDDASGALSLMYVSLNGKVCTIPSSLQNISGLSQGWAKDDAVVAFQPDANRSAVEYDAVVKMNAWMW